MNATETLNRAEETVNPVRCIKREHSVYTTCKCPPCTTQRQRAYKRYRAGMGRPSPEAALELLEGWLDAGYDPRWISSATGVPVRFMESLRLELRRGHRRRIGPLRAQQVLTTRSIDAATEGHRRATGTTRRLQALARLGYPLTHISDATGIPLMTLSHLQRGQWEYVRCQAWHAITRLYDTVGLTPGPSTIAARRAERLRWPGSLAWDEDTLEDPSHTPDTGPVTGSTYAHNGTPSAHTADNVAWYLAEVNELATATEIGYRLKLTPAAVFKALERHTDELYEQAYGDTLGPLTHKQAAPALAVDALRDQLNTNAHIAGHTTTAEQLRTRRTA